MLESLLFVVLLEQLAVEGELWLLLVFAVVASAVRDSSHTSYDAEDDGWSATRAADGDAEDAAVGWARA